MITKLNKMTNQNMGSGGNQSLPSRGRAREFLAVWAEARMRRDRIWIGASPNPGHGRVATLALLSEMVVQNATRVPGTRNPTQWGGV